MDVSEMEGGWKEGNAWKGKGESMPGERYCRTHG